MMEPIVAGFQPRWADGFSDFLGAEILSWLDTETPGLGFIFCPSHGEGYDGADCGWKFVAARYSNQMCCVCVWVACISFLQ